MLKLHYAPNSRAERVLWLLEELELPYELNSMPFHPEALKSEEHRKRHAEECMQWVEAQQATCKKFIRGFGVL